MTLKYSPTTIAVSLLILGAACAAPQDLQHRLVRARVPILYEAYYPEQRNLSPRANLEEIRKLRELTSKLLKQEEELGELAAAVAEANPENVFEPRGQILEYVFSGQALPVPLPPAPVAATKNDDVEVASITVTDTGRHKRRHHHGEAEWMLRGVAAPSTR